MGSSSSRSNEKADEYARAAAEGGVPDSSVPDEYWWETSLSHMARAATEAWPRSTAQWIKSHVGPKRKYRPPRGKGVKHQLLRRARKSVASQYYQLLSRHVAIGPYLGTRSARQMTTAAGGAGDERNGPATICSRNAGSGAPRSPGYGRIL